MNCIYYMRGNVIIFVIISVVENSQNDINVALLLLLYIACCVRLSVCSRGVAIGC